MEVGQPVAALVAKADVAAVWAVVVVRPYRVVKRLRIGYTFRRYNYRISGRLFVFMRVPLGFWWRRTQC